MNIYFSETFKSLRKSKNLTQEQMAELLSISPQAISRWETGSTYPDITLLPIIANFFDLSIADLLGTGKDKIELRVNTYITQFQTAISQGAVDVCIDLMRTALIEFPNNYLLLSHLMYALYVASEDEILSKRYDEEIIAIGERILTYCHDDALRMEAKRLLFRHYCDTGRKTHALSIVTTLPEENASKEVNIYWALEGEERSQYLKERIDTFTTNLAWAIWAQATHSGTTEEKIKFLETLQKIEALIYENGDYGHTFYSQVRISTTLAELYLQLGQIEQGITAVNKAIQSAITYVSLPQTMSHTSPLIKGLPFDKHALDTSNSCNLCQELYEDYLSKPCFDCIRETSKIEILRNYF